MKVIVAIQCRLSSARLPAKALLSLADTTVLGMTIGRAKMAGYPVYLLTSEYIEDDLIEIEGRRCGVSGIIRGPLENVLKRFELLAESQNPDYFVRVTADNPLTEYRFISPIVSHLHSHGIGYGLVEPKFCPEGTNLEVFTSDELYRSLLCDQSDHNKEHVTPWMRSSNGRAACIPESLLSGIQKASFSDFSFTVDTLDDYIKVASLIDLCCNRYSISWRNSDFVSSCCCLASDPFTQFPLGRTHPLGD